MRDNELNEKEKDFIRKHPYAAAAIEHHRHRRLIWTGNGLKLPGEKRAPGEVERISAMPRGQKRVLQEYPPRGFNKGVYEVNQ